MAFVIVKVEPAQPQLGAADVDYLQEAQQEADATMQLILKNSEIEQQAQQQADQELLQQLPTTDPPKLKSAWPYLAAGAGILLLIALTSK